MTGNASDAKTARWGWSRSKDINSSRKSPPGWKADDVIGSVDRLYAYVEGQAAEAVGWYYRAKRKKSWGSWLARFGTILFTAIGGAMPTIVATWGPRPEQLADQLRWNQYGYLALGSAALLLALDRFSGGSSGWMRYINTATRLESLIEELRIDWQKLTMEIGGATPGSASVILCLDRLKEFSLAIRNEIEKETQAWIAEFQSNLQQLEKETTTALATARDEAKKEAEAVHAAQKTAAEANRPGAIDVSLKIDPATAVGITIEVDGQVHTENVSGSTCGIANVAPGLRAVTASAVGGDGKPRRVSRIVTVEGNKVAATTLELKLA